MGKKVVISVAKVNGVMEMNTHVNANEKTSSTHLIEPIGEFWSHKNQIVRNDHENSIRIYAFPLQLLRMS